MLNTFNNNNNNNDKNNNNNNNNNKNNNLVIISRSLDTRFTKYNNFVIIVDFIACVDDEALPTLCKNYSFHGKLLILCETFSLSERLKISNYYLILS